MKLKVSVTLYESYGISLISKEIEIPIGTPYSKLNAAVQDCGGDDGFKETLTMAMGQARAHQIFHLDALDKRDLLADIRQARRDRQVHDKANEEAEEYRKQRDAGKVKICELEKDIKEWECQSEGMMRVARAHEGKPTDMDVKGDHSECTDDVVTNIDGIPPEPVPEAEKDEDPGF